MRASCRSTIWRMIRSDSGKYGTRVTRPRNAGRTYFISSGRSASARPAALDVIDPHLKTMQWSRRAIGLKVFLLLLAAGWEGYAEAIRHQTRMGDLLRSELAAGGWKIENQTPLPVICFSDPGGADPHAMVMQVVQSGEAWISTTLLAGRRVARACITNYRTEPRDIEALVESLAGARGAGRTGSTAQAS